MKLLFSRAAEIDLAAAVAWYNEEEAHLGEVFLERVAGKLALIEDFPFLAPVCYQGIRVARVAPYRYSIYYLPDEAQDRAVVLAVEHDARDPEARHQRLEERRHST